MKTEHKRWQPIESAPKDETDILVFCPGKYGNSVWSARWESEPWNCWMVDLSFEVKPTHWQPLPEPPEVSDEK